MPWSPVFCSAVCAFLTLVGPGAGGQPVDSDELFLRQAGLKTDDASLLTFFRNRTLTVADEARVRALVRQLGDRSFRRRQHASAELIATGRSALVFVRPAVHDDDIEVIRRARRIISAINTDSEIQRVTAAGRLLAVRKPPGSARVILDYLPFAHDDTIEEEMLTTLSSVAWAGHAADADLVRALNDSQPAKRAAAGRVLGAGPDQALRSAVRPLLHDPDLNVRLRAAQGLLAGKDKEAIPTLIDLLAQGPRRIAWQAEDLLTTVAAEAAPPVSVGETATDVARARDAWIHWWDSKGSRLDLARLSEQYRTLGFTLIVAIDGYKDGTGQVWEISRAGHPLWVIRGVNRPMDARLLPGNRVLIAEYGGRRITIRDCHTGRVLQDIKTENSPSDVQILPNRHIFCAMWPNGLVEFAPDGKQVFSYNSSLGSVTSGMKLRDGHIVYATQNGFVAEIDEKGKELTHFKLNEPMGWRLGLDVLPGLRYLVAHQGANKVVEYDRTGKPLWECAATSPTHVSRLKNGHTLIACNGNLVIEVNRAGKVVWEQHLEGRPFRARRR